MPNKAVSYTQVPVTALEMESITLTPAGGTQVLATLSYQVKDNGGNIRSRTTCSKIYATPGAFTILDMVSVANAQEGT